MDAERRFRRVQGHADMRHVISALTRWHPTKCILARLRTSLRLPDWGDFGWRGDLADDCDAGALLSRRMDGIEPLPIVINGLDSPPSPIRCRREIGRVSFRPKPTADVQLADGAVTAIDKAGGLAR